jgi:hypothetical protein
MTSVVGNVGDGSSCVEESLDVGSDRLALLLLDHGQGVTSSFSMWRPFEVVDEHLLEVLPRVD